MPHPHLRVECDAAGYRRVLLARPERRNALDAGLAAALRDAVAGGPDVPLVLASAVPGVFCAGADLTVPEADRESVSDLLYDIYEAMITRPGPVIAAVAGPAVGGGAQLAAAADVRIAGPGARFRFAGPPGAGLTVGSWILPDLAGRGPALELLMTGRWAGAAEALALGLVSRIDDDPAAAADRLAAGLAAQPGAALGRAKKVTAEGGLLARLHAERQANRSAWSRRASPGVT